MTAAPPKQPIPPLARPVTTLWGVGPQRAALLARLEIHTVEDLLLHRPRRHEDRRHLWPIAELQLGAPAAARGKIVALGVKWFRQHTRSIFEMVLDDGTARLHCMWWNLPSMEKQFAAGDEVVVFGKPSALKPRTINHPETEVVEAGEEAFIHLNRLTPVYPLTEGLAQRWLRSLIWRALQSFESQIAEPWPLTQVQVAGSGLPVRSRRTALEQPQPPTPFPSRAKAIQMLHFPDEEGQIETARRRLALDELIALQRNIQLRRKNFETKAQGLPSAGDNHLLKPFLARLGFQLTQAQTQVLRQLRKDMGGPHPMRRLLQGDVGSGKTVVAACCALMALESGYSVALMAPTGILAEQHFQNFTNWFKPMNVAVELQTGTRKTSRNQQRITNDGRPLTAPGPSGRLAAGTLFIGTHALLTEGFELPRLGLVIIDEQHRFGVAQREKLVRKGHYPHLLVMTATPIPRTLGLTLYGELDVSVIDELPPGRGRLNTFVRTAEKLPQVWGFIREKLAQGRQAYVVYPRVEENGDDIKAVTKEFENLKQKLAPFRVGLLHGRLGSRDKEEIMGAFRANRTQVLLATSLVDVGVDVPNATLMLIENAEQFGLAQLHQLRGRIGRGRHDSYCILVAGVKGKESPERLKVLEETTDGFRIAEADLKLRGPGELLGQQQSGLPKFRFADLAEDFQLICQARNFAARILEIE